MTTPEQIHYDACYNSAYNSAMNQDVIAIRWILEVAEVRFTKLRDNTLKPDVAITDDNRLLWRECVAEIDALKAAIIDKILTPPQPKPKPEPSYTKVLIYGQDVLWDEATNILYESRNGQRIKVGTFTGHRGFTLDPAVEERFKENDELERQRSYNIYSAAQRMGNPAHRATRR